MNPSLVPVGKANWRGLLASERVVAHNLVVGAGTMAAGVLGVAFQSLISHRLTPADYGAVFAVLTVITLIGLPASASTLLMARETSRDRATGHHLASAALLRGGSLALMVAGLSLAVLFVVFSPILAPSLKVPAGLLVAAAVSTPFGLAMPLLLGEFQGEQRFVALSILSTGQAALKLLMAVALGSVWGPLGIVVGVSLAGAAAYFVALGMLKRKFLVRSVLPWWRPAATYLAVVLPSTAALSVLLSTDILLVKHFFPTHLAGEFAAVAALGRAIFWGASGVAVVLFPKVVFRAAQGKSGYRLVGASLVLVALGGLAGLAILSLASRWLLVAFAGTAYAEAAMYLPWYAIGMVLLGAAAVLIATHQSRGSAGFLAILIPLTATEPALLLLFHKNLWQVVQVVDVSMAFVAIGLGALYLIQHRVEISTTSILATSAAPPTNLAQVG